MTRSTVLKTSADSATAQPCKGLSWTYDACWGNRTDQTQTAGTCGVFHATANTQNRLIDTVNNTLLYDAAGNLTFDGSHHHTYDAENRLITVDGSAATYIIYDGEGKRLVPTIGSVQTTYLYDLAANVVAEDIGTSWGPGPACPACPDRRKGATNGSRGTCFLIRPDRIAREFRLFRCAAHPHW